MQVLLVPTVAPVAAEVRKMNKEGERGEKYERWSPYSLAGLLRVYASKRVSRWASSMSFYRCTTSSLAFLALYCTVLASFAGLSSSFSSFPLATIPERGPLTLVGASGEGGQSTDRPTDWRGQGIFGSFVFGYSFPQQLVLQLLLT